jgi:hypothetical protein
MIRRAIGPASGRTDPRYHGHCAVVSCFRFVGGFVGHNNAIPYEVQIANKLNKDYPEDLQVRIFENHRGQQARKEIFRLLDTNRDGVLSGSGKWQRTHRHLRAQLGRFGNGDAGSRAKTGRHTRCAHYPSGQRSEAGPKRHLDSRQCKSGSRNFRPAHSPMRWFERGAHLRWSKEFACLSPFH